MKNYKIYKETLFMGQDVSWNNFLKIIKLYKKNKF